MPGKHVHFADFFPPTPSPSFSVASLPSTSGPYTPLPIHQFGSPVTHVSLSTIPVRIHPALGYSYTPYLNYDISCPPTTVTPYHPSLSSHVLSEAATNPQLPCISVTSPYLPSSWTITIMPSNGSYVTVADVLSGLYRGLRFGVGEVEFNSLPSGKAKHRVNEAYKRRCARIADPTARRQETDKGLKRIDFFATRNKFMGLSSTKQGPHVWTVHVS